MEEYLAGALADREAVWRERIGDGIPPGWLVLTAWDGPVLTGFLCLQSGVDPLWGALVDNLHVDPERKGRGMGRRLMAAAAAWLIETDPGSPMHLFAFEKNVAACEFYRRIGGAVVEHLPREAPDGRQLPEFRFFWKDPRVLLP